MQQVSWIEVTQQALISVWEEVLLFLPRLLAALVVFIIGWILAKMVYKVVSEILTRIKFDKIFEKAGWLDALEKAEIKTKPAEFVGEICKWIILIVFLVSALKVLFVGYILDLGFLDKIVGWLPNLVVAVIIFVVATIIADILGKVIRVSLEKSAIAYSKLIGNGVKWAIYILAGLMILRQLGVTPTIIDLIVTGFIGTFMLAFGIAFGLGGKEIAAEILRELKKKIS